MSTLKLGVSLPNSGGGDGVDVRDAARHLEDLGFESVWVPDLTTGDGRPPAEAIITLSTAAAVTDRIGVGFGVLVLPLRPVAAVVAQLATLQQLSGGRLLLGVGAGGFPGTPYWKAVGAPTVGRGRSTDTALTVLPRLLAGEQVSIESDQDPVTLAPAGNGPPILVGGNSDGAIRRATVFGNEWFPSLTTPDELVSRAKTLHTAARHRGRETPGITVGGHVMVGSPGEVESPRTDLVRSLVDVHGMSAEQAAKVPITGEPHAVAEHLAAFAAAGVRRVVLNIDGIHWYRQSELLAEAAALLRER